MNAPSLRPPGRAAPFAAALAAFLAPSIAGCGGPREPDRPDVVLVVIDTLRADRLSCYGYERPTSPFLDSLAEEGTLFEDHTCQFAWTLPSMVSLFTGRYVPLVREQMIADAPTLAESFQSAGYRTLGVVANQLVHPEAGFDRGFDHFDARPSRITQPVGEDVDNPRRIAELCEDLWGPLEEALEVDASGERPPVFVYLHPLDPHDPYKAWPELMDVLPIGGAAPLEPEGWHDERLDAAGNERRKRDEELLDLLGERGRYDQEIRAMDDELRAAFARLGELGVLDDCVVVVCADHGEGLWDHESPMQKGGRRRTKVRNFFYQIHGQTLHEEIVATPWILWGRGVPAGLRVRQGTENVDVFPTLLELCDLPAPAGPLHGRSVVPLLEGRDTEWRDYVFSAASRGRATVREVSTGLKLHLHRGALKGKESRAAELYDLRADPLERHDLAAERPADVERLRDKILTWFAEHPLPPVGEGDAPSEAFLERLRQLGYTGEDTGIDGF